VAVVGVVVFIWFCSILFFVGCEVFFGRFCVCWDYTHTQPHLFFGVFCLFVCLFSGFFFNPRSAGSRWLEKASPTQRYTICI